MRVGIFPAAGGLGGSTYKHLLKLIPANQVVLISRNPDKVPREYLEAGAVLRQASYESSPEELEKVFSGVETLFLISYPSHVHEYRVKVCQQPRCNPSSLTYARSNFPLWTPPAVQE